MDGSDTGRFAGIIQQVEKFNFVTVAADEFEIALYNGIVGAVIATAGGIKVGMSAGKAMAVRGGVLGYRIRIADCGLRIADCVVPGA